MNTDQAAGLLIDDWHRALRHSLALEVVTRGNESPPRPEDDADWMWLGVGAAPFPLYVGATDEAWSALAGWVGGGMVAAAEGEVPRACRTAAVAAWAELARRLGLVSATEPQADASMSPGFDPGTFLKATCVLGLPGASRILLATAFAPALLRDARKFYESERLGMDLAGLPFPLHVTLGRTVMELKDVLRLAEGNVIELGKRTTDPIEIYVSGRFVGEGRVAACGERYGIGVIGPSEVSQGESES